jgi:hypothetical protein
MLVLIIVVASLEDVLYINKIKEEFILGKFIVVGNGMIKIVLVNHPAVVIEKVRLLI